MERNNSKQDYVLRELRVAEAIVDEILSDLDALREMTGKNGPLDSLLDKVIIYLFCQSSQAYFFDKKYDPSTDSVLLTFSNTCYCEMLQRCMENLQKFSKKMEEAHQSKPI